MLEALRGLGYSTASALADIIDNSISAGASEVNIHFVWEGPKSRIFVIDNGRGMTDSELESAMRLGDKSPLDERHRDDLGRFGMGMKTASLSQCRRLTVASLREGASLCCLRWDLDELAAHPDGGWLLFEGPAAGSESVLAMLEGMGSGTLVVWELLDRVVTRGFAADDFLNVIDNVEKRLAMVFHRLLAGPHAALRLTLNDRPVEAWDPFMTGHSSKPWNSPVTRLTTSSGIVEVECHVLPHRDRLTPVEHDLAAGPEGWTAQQGLYVYRNRRLLLAGGWLGLGHGKAWNREEAHRLARIRVDIPNTADADWKIDIRKSTARPPVSIRPWLTKLAEDTRERARRVFAFRGAPVALAGGGPIEQAWRVDRSGTGVRYQIDQKHPAVAAVLEATGAAAPLVKAMLRVIEETVPVQRVWLDTAENRETPRTGFSGQPRERVLEVMETIYADMLGRRGMSSEDAKRMLRSMEPFQAYPELIRALAIPTAPDGQ